MKRNDLILIACILILSVGAFFYTMFSGKNGEHVVISVDGRIYAILPCDKDTVFSIGDTNTIEIKGGEVRMIDAACPDKLCIHQGVIRDNSKTIVCLPNKVVVNVTAESELDHISK